jgi:predicted short-subunit dehydrogenase-like oxidoreductase (DUF2520 family)
MPSTPTPCRSLTVVGAGRLGRTLARLWAESEAFTIGRVYTRSSATAEAAVAFIGTGRACHPDASPGPVDCALLAVPDDRLAEAANRLATEAEFLPGAIVFHCSGAHAAAVLDPLRTVGALVASAHPMHSFAEPARSLETFAGTFCALEGDPPALELLGPAFAAIGARPLAIRGEAKLLYHAAGVFGSNYVTVLVDAALHLLGQAGIDAATGRKLLGPLLRGAVDSALALGPGAALTGPVARGDAALVARQAAALETHDQRLGDLYRQLALAAVTLAADAGRLDGNRVRDLRQALDVEDQPSNMRTPTTQSVTAKP